MYVYNIFVKVLTICYINSVKQVMEDLYKVGHHLTLAISNLTSNGFLAGGRNWSKMHEKQSNFDQKAMKNCIR